MAPIPLSLPAKRIEGRCLSFFQFEKSEVEESFFILSPQIFFSSVRGIEDDISSPFFFFLGVYFFHSLVA